MTTEGKPTTEGKNRLEEQPAARDEDTEGEAAEELQTYRDNPQARELHTIHSDGHSATVEAFALHRETQELWFLSIVGSHFAVKGISDAMRPPLRREGRITKGAGGMLDFSEDFPACQLSPRASWRTRMARLPQSKAWHHMMYTPMGMPNPPTGQTGEATFLLLAEKEEDGPARHHLYLDKRCELPLHPHWSQWLWLRGLVEGEIQPLESQHVKAWLCHPNVAKLTTDLSSAVAGGLLRIPPGE